MFYLLISVAIIFTVLTLYNPTQTGNKKKKKTIYGSKSNNPYMNIADKEKDNKVINKVEVIGSNEHLTRKINELDSNFEINDFEQKATKAYKYIVQSYKEGDVEKLKDLLEEKVFIQLKANKESSKNSYQLKEFLTSSLIRIKEVEELKYEITVNFVTIQEKDNEERHISENWIFT